MKLKNRCMIFVVVALPFSAIAQQQHEACDALLEHGISNVVAYSSEYDYLLVVNDEYCSQSYSTLSSSKQASFGATIKKIPLSLKGNSSSASEQHSSFCRKFSEIETDSGQSRYRASNLYDKAIDAWRDCVSLALGGTQIKPSITPNQKVVDFTLAVTSGSSKFTGVDTTNASCKMDGQDVGADEDVALTSVAKSLRCVRSSTKLEFLGSEVDFYPVADVKVKTTTGDYRVDLYEMIDGPAQSRLQRLEFEIASLRKSQNETDLTVAGLGMSREGTSYSVTGPRIAGPDKQDCPPGSYVSSIHASGSVGGKYGVDGISRITFTCAPLDTVEMKLFLY